MNRDKQVFEAFLYIFRQALGQLPDISYGRANLCPERPFCYALYNKVEQLIESDTRKRPDLWAHLAFEGELPKSRRIGARFPQLRRAELLRKPFTPDFVLHSPGNIDHQILVVEVKTAAALGIDKVKADLWKIQQCITQLNFQQGLFLVMNNPAQRMREMLADQENQRWIVDNLPDRSRIFFICQENPETALLECTLDLLPMLPLSSRTQG